MPKLCLKTFFICLLCLTTTHESRAGNIVPMGQIVAQSRDLLQRLDPSAVEFFRDTRLRYTKRYGGYLARYNMNPNTPGHGTVELPEDIKTFTARFFRDEAYPATITPDMEEYMIALTTLSLANEMTHYKQDKNSSLADFTSLQQRNDIPGACALYALQQHASDMVMLATAYKMEKYYREVKPNTYMVDALYQALRGMNIESEYSILASAIDARNLSKLNNARHIIKQNRERLNVRNLRPCANNRGTATLSHEIIAKAVEPANAALNIGTAYSGAASVPKVEVIKRNYND